MIELEFKKQYDIHDKYSVLLLIGNGSFDEKVLEMLFPKLDGLKHSIAFPALPKPYRRKTGFRGIIDALSHIIHHIIHVSIKPRKVLIVIDHEHLGEEIDLEEIIREKGFDILESISLENKAFKYILTRGGFRFTLYIAVMGKTKSIEENIEMLEKLIYGDYIGRPYRIVVDKA